MDLYKLLTAVDTPEFGVNPPCATSASIAARLGVSAAEAETALRQAEQDGWVVEEQDESVNAGANLDGQLWHLSADGREELFRLQDAHGPG